jgi:hypothetical protein
MTNFSAPTTDLRITKLLRTELNEIALKYTHFELKSVVKAPTPSINNDRSLMLNNFSKYPYNDI